MYIQCAGYPQAAGALSNLGPASDSNVTELGIAAINKHSVCNDKTRREKSDAIEYGPNQVSRSLKQGSPGTAVTCAGRSELTLFPAEASCPNHPWIVTAPEPEPETLKGLQHNKQHRVRLSGVVVVNEEQLAVRLAHA